MECLLDVSRLEPPEPLERALDSVKALRDGQYLHILHRMEPLLLYPLLESMGFNQETCCDPQGMYHIFIWHPEDQTVQSEARHAIAGCCRT